MISLYPTESKIPHSGRCVNAGIFFIKTKKARFCRVFLMVVGQGFEPWKAMPTDLQGVDWVAGEWKNPCFIGV